MQGNFCNLCFAPCDNFAETIEEDARNSLVELLPHLEVKPRNYPTVACTNCSTRLRGYLEFKSSFLQAQACVLDPRQAYLQNKSKRNELSAKEDVVVCRFCLKQTIGAYTRLVEDQKDLASVTITMGRCFPGLELGTFSGCVICVECHQALEAAYNFIQSVDVEDCIKVEDAVTEMRNQNVDDISEGDVEIKEEIVEVVEHSLSSIVDNACDVKVEQATGASVKGRATSAQSRKMYKCETCSYKTKHNYCWTRHVLIHKDPSEVIIYKCDFCSYETRRRADYKKHTLIHKDPSEVTMYKCDVCLYETRHKSNYNQHIHIHKDASEVTFYKCQVCSYETRHRANYKKHTLIHKDPSEVTMYKCDVCSYETRQKTSYNQHILIHKDPSEVTMYKCKVCSYETRHRSSYNRHTLIHKNPSKVTMYKCDVCSYKTKHNYCWTRHVLIHKKPSEVTMYKCDTCSYATRHKDNYNRHTSIHKNALPTFKCRTCPFETKNKYCYNQHMLMNVTCQFSILEGQ